jgi:hypothetical protein
LRDPVPSAAQPAASSAATNASKVSQRTILVLAVNCCYFSFIDFGSYNRNT